MNLCEAVRTSTDIKKEEVSEGKFGSLENKSEHHDRELENG